ncbi:hypothetical protein [Actinomadura rugatobispora]|uniref:ABC transporter permease n=1 Tax=Actinomadura rugatobispora TaxID=1994 RepID=A0ABW1A8J2_9ACTN|nr:hypothetical protein GCM10010200_026370 [Actinomadura rugatobispora]
MEETRTAEETGGEPDRLPRVEAATLDAMIKLIARLLRGNPITLAPATLITAALTVPGFMIILLNLDGQAIIVNGELRPADPKRATLITGFVVSAVLLAAHLVTVATVAVMAAGALLERRVRPGQALRYALRRSGPFLVLLPVTGGAVLAVGAVMACTPIATRTWLFVSLVLALLALATSWLLLTVPVVVLEHAGPFRALSRLWKLTKARRTSAIWSTLLIGILFPVLLGMAVRWLVAQPFSGVAQTAAEAVVTTVMGVFTVLVQGATVAAVTLNQLVPRQHENLHSMGLWDRPPHPMKPAEVAARLPSPVSARGRARWAIALAVVTSLVAPGLLYGGYLQANPLSLPSITDRPVRAGESHNELLLLDGRSPAIITEARDDSDEPEWYNVQACADTECRRSSSYRFPYRGREDVLRSVPLPDGSMAIAWSHGREIRLMQCTAEGCPNGRNVESYPVIAETDFPWIGYSGDNSWDIAPSGRGIVAAALSAAPRGGKDDADEERDLRRLTMQIVQCADMRCARPRTLATVPFEASEWTDQPRVTIATGAGDRPVVVFENSFGNDVAIITCDDAACRNPTTRRYKPVRSFGFARAGVHRLAVPVDDRPVLAYRDREYGELRLLRCRTPDCAGIDQVTLAEPDGWSSYLSPDLAVGPGGLPWIATFDTTRRKIALHACEVADCTRRTTVPLLADVDPVGTLQLAMTRDGRPQVLWSYEDQGEEQGSADDVSVNRLLTCRDPRCGT